MKRFFTSLSCVSLVFLAIVLSFQGCKKFENDVTTPAFLRLDRLSVQRQAVGAPATDAGWYTSDIDAVQFIAYFAGDEEETIIGTFQLPCCVPVLYDGKAEYLRVVPVVKQNGIASTRIEYPYFADTTLYDVQFTPGSTTPIGTYDADADSYWLPVYYKSTSLIGVLVYENFEPLNTSIVFDTATAGVEWVRNQSDVARTGSGCLHVYTDSALYSVSLPIVSELVVEDATKSLYLEMDYRTDVHLRVGINSAYTSGGSAETQWVMTLYPNQQWQKIYINLGKLWSQFNHYSNFTVLLSTLNTTGQGGHTYIDNLKIITI